MLQAKAVFSIVAILMIGVMVQSAQAATPGIAPQQLVAGTGQAPLSLEAANALFQAGYPLAWFDFSHTEKSTPAGYSVFVPLKADYQFEGRVLEQVAGTKDLPVLVAGVLYVKLSGTLPDGQRLSAGLHFVLVEAEADSVLDPPCTVAEASQGLCGNSIDSGGGNIIIIVGDNHGCVQSANCTVINNPPPTPPNPKLDICAGVPLFMRLLNMNACLTIPLLAL